MSTKAILGAERVLCQANVQVRGNAHRILPQTTFASRFVCTLKAVASAEEDEQLFGRHMLTIASKHFHLVSSMELSPKPFGDQQQQQGRVLTLSDAVGGSVIELQLDSEAQFREWQHHLADAVVCARCNDAFTRLSPLTGRLSATRLDAAIKYCEQLVDVKHAVLERGRYLSTMRRQISHILLTLAHVGCSCVSTTEIASLVRKCRSDGALSIDSDLDILQNILTACPTLGTAASATPEEEKRMDEILGDLTEVRVDESGEGPCDETSTAAEEQEEEAEVTRDSVVPVAVGFDVVESASTTKDRASEAQPTRTQAIVLPPYIPAPIQAPILAPTLTHTHDLITREQPDMLAPSAWEPPLPAAPAPRAASSSSSSVFASAAASSLAAPCNEPRASSPTSITDLPCKDGDGDDDDDKSRVSSVKLAPSQTTTQKALSLALALPRLQLVFLLLALLVVPAAFFWGRSQSQVHVLEVRSNIIGGNSYKLNPNPSSEIVEQVLIAKAAVRPPPSSTTPSSSPSAFAAKGTLPRSHRKESTLSPAPARSFGSGSSSQVSNSGLFSGLFGGLFNVFASLKKLFSWLPRW